MLHGSYMSIFNKRQGKVNSSEVSILTPIFLNSISGASVYYRSLSKELVKSGYSVTVFSELCGDSSIPEGVEIRRLIPCRSHLQPRSYKNFMLYALQNWMYFSLMFRVNSNSSALIVHSSFINYPSVFLLAIRLLKLVRPKLLLILDVRDNLMPQSKRKKAVLFDRIICCSEQIIQDYALINSIKKKLIHIPIPVDNMQNASPSASFNIFPDKQFAHYIFYAGLIKESKNIHILLNSFLKFVRPKYPELLLVLAGEVKSTRRDILHNMENNGVHYLGIIPNEELRVVIQNSSLCVNLSENEGLPRFSLEAIFSNTPLLFAKGVLEFDRHCPDFSIKNLTEENVAKKMLEILENGRCCTAYPIEEHHLKKIIDRYILVLRGF